jgi:hypothetical protein
LQNRLSCIMKSFVFTPANARRPAPTTAPAPIAALVARLRVRNQVRMATRWPQSHQRIANAMRPARIAPVHINHGGFWKIHWMTGVTLSPKSSMSTVESAAWMPPGSRMVEVS